MTLSVGQLTALNRPVLDLLRGAQRATDAMATIAPAGTNFTAIRLNKIGGQAAEAIAHLDAARRGTHALGANLTLGDAAPRQALHAQRALEAVITRVSHADTTLKFKDSQASLRSLIDEAQLRSRLAVTHGEKSMGHGRAAELPISRSGDASADATSVARYDDAPFDERGLDEITGHMPRSSNASAYGPDSRVDPDFGHSYGGNYGGFDGSSASYAGGHLI